MSAAARWMLANPEAVSCVIALVLWLAANIAKRHPPAVRSGWRWWLWLAVERAMVLPWDRWFGALHLPFRVEPALDALEAIPTPEPASGERPITGRPLPAPPPPQAETEPDPVPVELDADTPPTPRNDVPRSSVPQGNAGRRALAVAFRCDLDNGPLVPRIEGALARGPLLFKALLAALRVSAARSGIIRKTLVELQRKKRVKQTGQVWCLATSTLAAGSESAAPDAPTFELRSLSSTTWVVGWLPSAPHITRSRWVHESPLPAEVEAAKRRVAQMLRELPVSLPALASASHRRARRVKTAAPCR